MATGGSKGAERRVVPPHGRAVLGFSPLLVSLLVAGVFAADLTPAHGKEPKNFDKAIRDNAADMVKNGQQIFRFDTFGDEAFWGDTLQDVVSHYNDTFGLGLSATEIQDLVEFLKSI